MDYKKDTSYCNGRTGWGEKMTYAEWREWLKKYWYEHEMYRKHAFALRNEQTKEKFTIRRRHGRFSPHITVLATWNTGYSSQSNWGHLPHATPEQMEGIYE